MPTASSGRVPGGGEPSTAFVRITPPCLQAPSAAANLCRQHSLSFTRALPDGAQYAPDLPECIADWQLFTPQDIEARVGLTDGNIRHLDIVPGQFLATRPMPGWAHYRTPIRGLYLCGAGTHPGGEVTGAPGHNAAQAMLADFR